MESLVLSKMYFNPSKNKCVGIRFKDGSWFQVSSTTLPTHVLLNAYALIDLDTSTTIKCVPSVLEQEIEYVVNHHRNVEQLPILELLHAVNTREQQCIVLASPTNLIIVFCHGCSAADINKARSAYYGGNISGIAYDDRIEELIRIQQECEVEKTSLIAQRRKALRTSSFVFTDVLRASLLPWETLRSDFGYVGDLLHTCATCGSSNVDKFIVTESLVTYLGGEVDDTYVRCLNPKCSNSGGHVFAGEDDKPEWLLPACE